MKLDIVKSLGAWHQALANEFTEPYMKFIGQQLARDEKKLAPDPDKIFRAFELTDPSTVKVVILGQDPYIKKGQADGLAFSTQQPETPFSLRTVFTELDREGFSPRFDANLEDWAKQGVLLLNTTLTTIIGSIGYHDQIGWNLFIRAALRVLSPRVDIVYLAWGDPAKIQLHNILPEGMVLTAAHPAAVKYNSRNTFIGCNHFNLANQYLIKHGRNPIKWT